MLVSVYNFVTINFGDGKCACNKGFGKLIYEQSVCCWSYFSPLSCNNLMTTFKSIYFFYFHDLFT